jgi:hypothetical protein
MVTAERDNRGGSGLSRLMVMKNVLIVMVMVLVVIIVMVKVKEDVHAVTVTGDCGDCSSIMSSVLTDGR